MKKFEREEIVLGKGTYEKLKNKKVIIFGIGGVGSYVCEALARCGIENFTLVDNDTVNETNINRQLIALESTIGKDKVEVMKDRIKDINSNANVIALKKFFMPENSNEFSFNEYDYIIDAIDTVTAKIELVRKANEAKTPIIASMGTGNKIDPCSFKVADINKTTMCPLAKVMRKELKKINIKKLKVVYSTEKPNYDEEVMKEVMKNENTSKNSLPGSLSFMPSVCGLIIASEVIKDLLK